MSWAPRWSTMFVLDGGIWLAPRCVMRHSNTE
jgi:hypothetical protein